MLDKLLDGAFKCGVPFSYSQTNNFFGAVHMGASDTTSGHTLASILFLAKYPEYQEKARTELNSVCGTERMPQWSDFKDLPYINCIVKEGLRFRAA
jgi:cytochrome P450